MNRYVLVFLLFVIGTVAAHPVGVKMKFSVSSSDTVTVNQTTYLSSETVSKTFENLTEKYISSSGILSNNYYTIGLIFAGSEFYNLVLNKNENQYDFLMKQKQQRNRFILSFSKRSNIKNSVLSVDNLLSTSISYISLSTPSRFFILLDYLNKNIGTSLHVGTGYQEILIRNNQGLVEFELL